MVSIGIGVSVSIVILPQDGPPAGFLFVKNDDTAQVFNDDATPVLVAE